MKRRWGRSALSFVVLFVLSGCSVRPAPFSDREFAAKADVDRAAMFRDQDGIDAPLSLGVAVARVIRYNLDHRVKLMEQAQALDQLDLTRWDLLPHLAASAGYAGRSDHATTSSRDSVTLEPALSNPYYSQDRDRIVADSTISWNILDFGVSYCEARQNADRVLIAEERRRKAMHNLVREVRQTFWRALAAQELRERVAQVIADADHALAASEQVEEEQLRSPVETLHYRKTLLENLRQLEVIDQELASAKDELAALINVAPGSPITLEKPDDQAMELPEWSMPVEQMEEAAFIYNPDLREQLYQGRMAVEETRKAFLRLLPGMTFTGGREYDSNSFLVHNMWNEAAAKVSWNLVDLVSAPDRIRNAHNNEDLAEKRRLAMRMAVLAQVHISRQQYRSAMHQFQRADALFKIERKLAKTATERQANLADSELESIGTQTSAIAAELRRYQALALAQAALGRMESTMGIDVVTPDMAGEDTAALGAKITRRLDLLDHGTWTFPPVEREGTSLASAASPVASLPGVE